jgi:hypothetical protein
MQITFTNHSETFESISWNAARLSEIHRETVGRRRG